jgi:3-dehydroquinate synthase class II
LYLTDTSCIGIVALVSDRYTDRRKLITLTLASQKVDFDAYVIARRAQGDSWVQLSERLRREYGIKVPQGTLHRWFRDELADAA